MSFLLSKIPFLLYTWCICCWASLPLCLAFCTELNAREKIYDQCQHHIVAKVSTGPICHEPHFIWIYWDKKCWFVCFLFSNSIRKRFTLFETCPSNTLSQDFKICIGWNTAPLYASFSKIVMKMVMYELNSSLTNVTKCALNASAGC